MLSDYNFLRKILDRKKIPTNEEMNQAIQIMENTQLMSIQPREDDVRYQWINEEGHSYCADNKAVFVFTNENDMHNFAIEMLHWTEEELEKGIPKISISSLSDARGVSRRDVFIDCQVDPEKGYFVYNTQLGVWCMHHLPTHV